MSTKLHFLILANFITMNAALYGQSISGDAQVCGESGNKHYYELYYADIPNYDFYWNVIGGVIMEEGISSGFVWVGIEWDSSKDEGLVWLDIEGEVGFEDYYEVNVEIGGQSIDVGATNHTAACLGNNYVLTVSRTQSSGIFLTYEYSEFSGGVWGSWTSFAGNTKTCTKDTRFRFKATACGTTQISKETEFNVSPIYVPEPVISDVLVCGSDRIAATGSITAPTGYDSYRWFLNGVEDTNDTNRTYSISTDYKMNGTTPIGVRGVINGCSSDLSVATIKFTGINIVTASNGKLNVEYLLDPSSEIQDVDVILKRDNIVIDQNSFNYEDDDWPTTSILDIEFDVVNTGTYDINLKSYISFPTEVCDLDDNIVLGSGSVPPPATPTVTSSQCKDENGDIQYYMSFGGAITGDHYVLMAIVDYGSGREEEILDNDITIAESDYVLSHTAFENAIADINDFIEFSVRIHRGGMVGIHETTFSSSDISPPVPTFTGNQDLCAGDINITASPSVYNFKWAKQGFEYNGDVLSGITTAGTYTVHTISTDGFCYSDPATISVVQNIPNPPSISDVYANGDYALQSGAFSMSSSGFDSYNWYISESLDQSQTSNVYSNSITPAQDGMEIKVAGITTGGCQTNQSAPSKVWYTGITDITASNGTMTVVYQSKPNPTLDDDINLEIISPSGVSSGIFNYNVEDTEEWLGRQVTIPPYNYTYEGAGTYNITVTSKLYTHTESFVINLDDVPPTATPTVTSSQCKDGNGDIQYYMSFGGAITGDHYVLMAIVDYGSGREEEIFDNDITIAESDYVLSHTAFENAIADINDFIEFSVRIHRGGMVGIKETTFSSSEIIPPTPTFIGNQDLCVGAIEITASPSAYDFKWEKPGFEYNGDVLSGITTAGTYTVHTICTDGLCYSDPATVSVVREAPDPPGIADVYADGNYTLQSGEYSISSTGFYEYAWYISESQDQGQKGSTYTNSITPAQDRMEIKVAGITTGGCQTNQSAPSKVWYTGITDITVSNGTMTVVYQSKPNPTLDDDINLEIISPSGVSSGIFNYNVEDTEEWLERLVTMTYDYTNEGAGTYNITVTSNLYTHTESIVISLDNIPPYTPNTSASYSCGDLYLENIVYYLTISSDYENDTYNIYAIEDDGNEISYIELATGIGSDEFVLTYEKIESLMLMEDFNGLSVKTVRGVMESDFKDFNPADVTPSTPILNGWEELCLFDNEVAGYLEATSKEEVTYEWTLDDGSKIITNDGVYEPVFLALKNYYMSVSTVNAEGCRSRENAFSINVIDPSEMRKPILLSSKVQCTIDDITLSVLDEYLFYEWKIDGVINPNTTNELILNLTSADEILDVSVIGGRASGCASDILNFKASGTANCENLIHETAISFAGINDESEISNLDNTKKDDVWTYFDGLGRPMQSLQQQTSPNGYDIVQPIIYDKFGREVINYLPYVADQIVDGKYKPNPVNTGDELIDYRTSPQYLFYESYFQADVANPVFPYAEKDTEPSPLNRVLQQGSPGAEWQIGSGHTVGYDYLFNDANEVYLWHVDTEGNVYLDDDVEKIFYKRNQLVKNVITDENGGQVIEYKDKKARVILKKAQLATGAVDNQHDGWTCTYYVYDDFSNLRTVLPPELVKRITSATPGVSYAIPISEMDNYAFQYQYDGRQRMAIKKVPGAEAVYMIYDKRDRLILTQDGNQRSTIYDGTTGREWTFTKYDVLNRPIITGIYTHGTVLNQEDMQTHVNSEIASGDDFYEDFDESTNNHGYTNRTFPITATNVLTVTYYDNYDFIGETFFDEEGLNFDYDNSVNSALQPATANAAIRGQITGGKVKVLDPNGLEQYLNTATYYDDRYRMIQTITESHLGFTERSTSCFDDLSANVKESYLNSTQVGAPLVHRRFSYDHTQRLEYIEHSIDGESFVKIVENTYNELGELVEKELHQEEGNTSWQSVDFQYNIRGWLTHINDANLANPGDEINDLFGMELYYASGFDVPAYNGNISGVKWKSALDEDRMAYGYTYDKLNRIRSAHYVAGTNNNWKDEGYYNMEILGSHRSGDDYESGYDLNGNIKSLKRYGVVDNHQTAIDVLTYDYDNGNSGNQLLKVSDGGTEEGFKDGTADLNSDGLDYLYDANGNMIADDNKEIEQITYNIMNLPKVIDMTNGRKIEYIYDAAGIKLAQRVFEAETQSATKVTDYIGERVYETDAENITKLQFLHHEEGRIIPSPVAGPVQWQYQYHLKDHLGNIRLTFGAAETKTYILTMEVDPAENRIIEAEDFENVYESEYSQIVDLNHTAVTASTPNPEYSAWLNGTDRVIGPAKSLKVLPGDVVEIEAWAKYLHLESYDPSVPADMLLGGFFGAFLGAGSEMLINQGYVDEGLLSALANVGNGGLDLEGVPKAYINYVLFDKDYQVIEGKKLQISGTAKFEIGDTDLGTHEHMVIDPIVIAKEGYVYIYLSNQTPGSDVYFDDLMVTHTQSTVIQKNDYYPFGLSIAGLNSNRENTLANNYLYNGKELQTDLNLDWYDYGARMYDAAIGRWHVVDRLADSYYDISPYHYVRNNPLIFVDPNGMGDYYSADGTLLGNDGIDDDIIYQTTSDVWNENTADDVTDHETVRGTGGTHNIGTMNEFGLIQLTEMGNDYIVNNDASEDSYSYSDANGELVAAGQHGDDWVQPSVGASFNASVNAFAEMVEASNIVAQVSVVVNDASAFNPSVDLRHQTHFTGESIDYRFLTTNGVGSNNYQNLTANDFSLNMGFVNKLTANGFQTHYSESGIVFGSVHSAGHHNHLHSAR